MGKIMKIYCPQCGFSVETRGFDEFYRDKNGGVKSYGHPHAINGEARNAGVRGTKGDVFCIQCGKVIKDYVLQETQYPVYPDKGIYSIADNEVIKHYRRNGNICPECNGQLVLFLYEKNNQSKFSNDVLGTAKCPKCNCGILQQKLIKQY